MIEINITCFEEQAKKYLNMLTDNKSQELRKEMIKFLKENNWPDSLEYCLILKFINDFFVTSETEEWKIGRGVKKNIACKVKNKLSLIFASSALRTIALEEFATSARYGRELT